MLIRRLVLIIMCIAASTQSNAQYISQCEAIPFPCPVLCAGGTLFLRVFQVTGLNPGDELLVELSDASGVFGSGQILSISASSIDNGGVWIPGNYNFTADVNNLMIAIDIPSATPGGNAYKVRLRTSAGFFSTELFNCGGGNQFTINGFVPPLAQVSQNSQGNNQWIGHVYSWTPSYPGVLSMPQVALQNFFNPTNYLGHVVYNTLSFDINHFFWGFIPGTINNGTSISCENTVYENFSIRMLRNENFQPGLYRFTIAGDDGIRISVDGGATWLVTSWAEQGYGPSLRTSDATHPNGVCLSGPTDLVYEYFQRPQESRMTLQITQLSTFTTIPSPSDQSICQNGSTSFNVGNSTAFTYQWQVSTDGGTSFSNISNSAPYTGATTSTLNLTSVPSSFDGAQYQCVATDACNNVSLSLPATLNVNSIPQISQQPVNASICPNQNAQFSVTVLGDVVNYQWQISTDGGATFNNIPVGTPFSGVNTANLSIQNPPSTMNGNVFRVNIIGCAGPVLSNTATLTLSAPTNITQQPNSLIICAGDQAIFSVSATGATTYQWQVNSGSGFVNLNFDANTSGVSTNTLTLTGTSISMNGNTYQCIIDDGCGILTSSTVANLSINESTIIQLQPQNIAACIGDNVQFDINASGQALSYQWQLSNNGGASYLPLSDNGTYTGTTTNSLQLNNITIGLDGTYFQCLVQGSCGNVIQSTAVVLTVTGSPSFTQQPIDQVICPGTNILFDTEITGNVLGYQWQLSTNSGVSYSNISATAPYSGVNQEDLNLTNPNLSLSGTSYQLILIGCGGQQVLSNPAQLIAGQALQVTSQPTNVTACEGDNAIFEVQATGATSYQWQANAGTGFSNIINGTTYTGAQSNLLVINNLGLNLNNYQFQCIVSGPCSADVTSTIVNLIVSPQTSVSSPNPAISLCEGNSTTLSVLGTGNSLVYQWQISLDGGTSFSNISGQIGISGENTSQLLISNADLLLNGAVFQCVVSGTCGGSVISATTLLTVNTLPHFLTQPTDIEICEGIDGSFTASLNTNATLQWQYSIDGGSNFTNVSDNQSFSGSNTNTLNVINANIEINGALFQLTANGCGESISSNNAELLVLPKPSINGFNPPNIICPNENTSISISSINATEYQWQMQINGQWTDLTDNATFTGTTDSILNLSNVNSSLQGVNFRCLVVGDCNPAAASVAIPLILNEYPEIISTPQAFPTCSGQTMTFPLEATGNGITYQWQVINSDGIFENVEDNATYNNSQGSTLSVQAFNEVNGQEIRAVIIGCGKTVSMEPITISILENNPVYIPNSFSPDGDYVNPVFKIYTEGSPIISASIYNRWGELIYTWDDKENGWDGTFHNTPVQEGVYVYKVRVVTSCDIINQTGTLTLIR